MPDRIAEVVVLIVLVISMFVLLLVKATAVVVVAAAALAKQRQSPIFLLQTAVSRQLKVSEAARIELTLMAVLLHSELKKWSW